MCDLYTQIKQRMVCKNIESQNLKGLRTLENTSTCILMLEYSKTISVKRLPGICLNIYSVGISLIPEAIHQAFRQLTFRRWLFMQGPNLLSWSSHQLLLEITHHKYIFSFHLVLKIAIMHHGIYFFVFQKHLFIQQFYCKTMNNKAQNT